MAATDAPLRTVTATSASTPSVNATRSESARPSPFGDTNFGDVETDASVRLTETGTLEAISRPSSVFATISTL